MKKIFLKAKYIIIKFRQFIVDVRNKIIPLSKYKKCKTCKYFHYGSVFVWCEKDMKKNSIIKPIKLVCFKYKKRGEI